MSRTLAIVGASARAAAASAARAGFQPIAADLFADADLRHVATATRISPYPEGLVDWLRAIEPPAWMYTGALENYPDLVDQMAWIAPLWGNAGDVLERVRSPVELAHVLRRAGLNFPETRDSAEGLPRDGSWLAKTYRGSSGSGVRVLGSEQGAPSQTSAHPTEPSRPEQTMYFQRRIAGTPCAAVYVAHGGAAELLGVTRQLIGELWLGGSGFQYVGAIGPLLPASHIVEAIKSIGQVLVQDFELVGLFGVDLIVDGDHVWAIEVNPRYTASVEIAERASGVRAIAQHAAACGAKLKPTGCGLEPFVNPQSLVTSPPFHGKAILFAKEPLVISSRFAEWSLAEALKSPWPMVADISPAGTEIEAGKPVCTLFAEGTTEPNVENRLRRIVSDVEAMLYATPKRV